MRLARNTTVWVSAALAALLIVPLKAQELSLRWTGTELRVSMPRPGILAGAPLERLRSGRTVTFDFQLELLAQGTVLRRNAERFLVSYDLWEERFSVTRSSRDAGKRESVSQLTAEAAEAWCLERMALPTAGIDENRSLTVRLEVREQEPRDANGPAEEPGISITGLIEIFSRPARTQHARWSRERNGVRLAALRKDR